MSERKLTMLEAGKVRLRRDPGGLILEADGVIARDLTPRRAFPWTAADRLVSLVNKDGETIGMIEEVAALEAESRRALEEELAAARFIPEIRRLLKIEFRRNLYQWEVETDRGPRTFRTSHGWGEDAVRRAPTGEVLITATDGLRYRLPEVARLTEREQLLLETIV